MTQASFRRSLAAVAALILCLTFVASPARADWMRAESERFIIYSDGDERTLRQYVQKLETFDRVLRIYMDLPPDEAPPRPLPIYLIGNHRQLTQVLPQAMDNMAGIYIAAEPDIFAVARRARRDDSTLLHEYAHHFMFQNFSFPYPAWFVEGFAEYYAATNITPNRVEVGLYDQNRVDWLLYGDWMAIEDVLEGRAINARGDRYNETYYPLAWLMTHWFMGDPQRRAVLQAYLSDVARGGDPVESMTRRTGMTPAALRNTLRSYMGRIPYSGIAQRFPEVPVTVTRLPASADDLLLINQRLKSAWVGAEPDELVTQVRSLAARHSGDPFAQLVLGRAEILYGDAAAGETALTAFLDQQPDHVEALQLMAVARRNGAAEHPEGPDVAMRQMRGFLQRAYDADDANYYTLMLIAESRIGEPGYPDDNDLMAWEVAHEIAPQLGQTRFGLAQALMAHGRNAEAIRVLAPLMNDPHNPQNAATVRMLIERAASGVTRPPPGGAAANDNDIDKDIDDEAEAS